MSLVLSQNTDLSVKDLAGVQLKWTSTLTEPLEALDLIYFDSVANSSAKIVLNTLVTSTEVSSSLLVAGRQYYFSLYAVDINGTSYTSNIYKPTAPYTLTAPVITSISGISDGVNINVTFPTLTGGEALTGRPLVTFIFLEYSTNTTPASFAVDASYGLSTYLIDKNSNPLMTNDNKYKVSCFIKPDSADTLHPAQSPLSNTMVANPSSLPDAPRILTRNRLATGNTPPATSATPPDFESWSISWEAPPDVDYWSRFDNSTVKAQIFFRRSNDSYPEVPDVVINNPPTPLKYTFTLADPLFINNNKITKTGYGWEFKMNYVNDNGAGAFSESAFYYNRQSPTAPQNLAAVVDASNSLVNVSWFKPANDAYANTGYQYIVKETKGGVDVSFAIPYATTELNKSFPYLASEAGSSASYSVVVTNKWMNDNSVILTSPPATQTLTLFTEPSLLTNCRATAGDKQITFLWDRPSVADGDDHTANEAKIIVTQVDTSFSRSLDCSGGSFTLTGLTNGLVYAADFYSVGTTPLGEKKQGKSKLTVSNIIPRGEKASPTNLQLQARDQALYMTWKEQVGDVIDGHEITGFAISGLKVSDGSQLSLGQGSYIKVLDSVNSPYVLESPALVNGEEVEVSLAFKFRDGTIGPFSTGVRATTFGAPSVSNIQLVGKSVVCSFNPNGKALRNFSVIGLPSVPRFNDQLILTTPSDMSVYPRDIKGIVTLTFNFTSVSGDLAAAILVLSTDGGSVVGNKGITFTS